MNAADVIGYAYEAEIHCADCTRARFPEANDEFSDVLDREGNEVHPVFAGDEHETTVVCGDCGDELYEVEAADEDDEPSEPDEDDITTQDHRRFFQHGKIVLEPYDRHAEDPHVWYAWIGTQRQQVILQANDYREALRQYVARDQFWPTCWFISDHGNAHVMDLA